MSKFKRSCMVVLLAAGMFLGATSGAHAIDFKAKGQWLVGFGLGDARLFGGANSAGSKNDMFGATQRVRLMLDAVASESLSGRVWFEIGSQDWGNGGNGGALGADGIQVKVKNAFLDWIVPETDLKFRMGIQNVYLPNAAGGTAIMGNADVAGITASYQFTDEVGLTAFWYRPLNDNYNGSSDADVARNGQDRSNYLDNLDLFGAAVPITLDGFEITPWIMYGIIGQNALEHYRDRYNGRDPWSSPDGRLDTTLFATVGDQYGTRNFNNIRGQNFRNFHVPGNHNTFSHRTNMYSSMFFAGLPIKVTAWDPINVEFDVNYGYVEGFGKDYVANFKTGQLKRADSKREGWLIKALVEYKMDWGVPGIFGWYSSGDDGDVKNGSERMPTIKGNGRFTSFMGAAGTDWYSGNFKGSFNEKQTTYSGTWGIGLQVRDMSFLEDLSHTFRVAYWGGTNSPDMVKYFSDPNRFAGTDSYDGPYLTTNDGLVELNLDSTYKIYENLAVSLDLGYIINCMDTDTWKHSNNWAGNPNKHMSQRDAWKAQLTFNYSF